MTRYWFFRSGLVVLFSFCCSSTFFIFKFYFIIFHATRLRHCRNSSQLSNANRSLYLTSCSRHQFQPRDPFLLSFYVLFGKLRHCRLTIQHISSRVIVYFRLHIVELLIIAAQNPRCMLSWQCWFITGDQYYGGHTCYFPIKNLKKIQLMMFLDRVVERTLLALW